MHCIFDMEFCWHALLHRILGNTKNTEQELSYHKQITHQLRTQYVEGIYDNPVTFKSRLRVIQGHWKRNH